MFALDLDGVLADSLTEATRLVCKALDIDRHSLLPHENYDDLAGGYPEELRKKARTLYGKVYRGCEAYAAALPIPCARFGVERLARMGLLSGYITRRPLISHDVSQAWLIEHDFPNAPLITVAREGSKGQAMSRLGATVLIEDSLSEARKVREEGFSAILIKQPYNAEGVELLSGDWDMWETLFFHLERSLDVRARALAH